MVAYYKMVVDDKAKLLKHMYIPTGIKRMLVKFSMSYDWKEQVVGTIC